MPILLGLIRHVNTLITIDFPTVKSFLGFFFCFFQHLPQFATHVLVSGCWTSVTRMCSRSHASTCHLLVFSSCIVERVKENKCLVWCRKAQKRQHVPGWDRSFFCQKQAKQHAWPLTSWHFHNWHCTSLTYPKYADEHVNRNIPVAAVHVNPRSYCLNQKMDLKLPG